MSRVDVESGGDIGDGPTVGRDPLHLGYYVMMWTCDWH